LKTLYTIIVYLINASTGDLEREYASSVPMTLEQCSQTLINRGPVLAKDGQAQFAVCRKVEAKVSL
jgi:hypothetical protein